ncbi:hypothetical protein IKG06_02485 [Candidatus Saccharibacteria bacterium]|nr:hypothetical protein [Candidatus Saccharibacteria bacterium]
MKKRKVGVKNKNKLITSLDSTIRKGNDPVFARKFVTWGVIISALMVGVSLFVSLYFNPERMGKRKFEELAKNYYETYYYDKFMNSIDSKVYEEKMKAYEKSGFQPVLLRQLLLYQNGKYSDYRGYFEKDGFNCDKNATSAKFYPVEPYGRTDYTVTYEYKCEAEG